jgi:hypothetical protein
MYGYESVAPTNPVSREALLATKFHAERADLSRKVRCSARETVVGASAAGPGRTSGAREAIEPSACAVFGSPARADDCPGDAP